MKKIFITSEPDFFPLKVHGSDVSSAMRAASQLPGRGPTVVDMPPYTCTLIKNPMMMMTGSHKMVQLRGHNITFLLKKENYHGIIH